MTNHTKPDRVIEDNAFKEENSIPSVMRETIPNKKKQDSTVHTVHTVHREKRVPIEIRMRRSIHENVGRYCGKSLSFGDFYEQAAILFMEINPKYESPINVSRPLIYDNDLEQNLSEIIYIGDLEDWLDVVRPIVNQGITLHKSKIKTLRAIIKECKKLNTRSEKLNQLLQEALEYAI